MTKVIFITSGEINYQLPGYNLFESIKLTAAGRVFPKLDDAGKDEVVKKVDRLAIYKPEVIFSATSRQCLDTGKIFSRDLKLPLLESINLLPLRFDLSLLMEKKEFVNNEDRFDILRQRYLEAFFENKLLDDNKEIIKRFNRFALEVKNINKKVVIAVSHAYLIRLFSIYNEVGLEMYQNKVKLFKMFKPEMKTMKRLEIKQLELVS